MNGQAIYELFLDGAYHEGNRLFHPSFRKGFRKIVSGNIALVSAERKLRAAGRLQSGLVNGLFRIEATKA